MENKGVYILIRKNKNILDFSLEDLILRKISNDKWSFIVWKNVDDAKIFLKDVAKAEEHYNVVEIDKEQYNDFITRNKVDSEKYLLEIK